MEVVCLILGPMLACLPAFWVLTSLHLLSPFIENVFYYSCILTISYDNTLHHITLGVTCNNNE